MTDGEYLKFVYKLDNDKLFEEFFNSVDIRGNEKDFKIVTLALLDRLMDEGFLPDDFKYTQIYKDVEP